MNTKNALIIGGAIIIAVGLLAFTWFKIDSNRRAELTEQKRLDQQTEISSQAKTNLDSTLLQSCMDNATSRYPEENMDADVKRDPANSQQYVDLYYKIKSEEEASCKTRYAN